MDKYGAELNNEKVKEAGEGKDANSCPICGKDAGESKNCPDHGTEGFEKKPEQKLSKWDELSRPSRIFVPSGRLMLDLGTRSGRFPIHRMNRSNLPREL